MLVDEVTLGARVRAGFTSRRGGVSAGAYTGLNLGDHVGDEPQAVDANRALVADWAGAALVFPRQVHGRGVVVLDAVPGGSVGEADAVVSTSPDVAVAVVVADCVPVLLADDEAGVVAAVHAGRPGLVAGVLQAALDAMVRAGARRERVAAALGPSIAGASYEVPAPMRDAVTALVPETSASTSWGTPALDLPAGVIAVLRREGVRSVLRAAADTFTVPDYYSYRRDGVTGRFAGVVRPLP
ncbi:peptidoglycan editing factor PgeF [Cellulomonas edaphi]|uniref:Purine nucleoside phosphorylase n=1 Tax=Cellulomonas edaphi TaxID=3053468 RepID=A0ABT7S8S8_9CELL|nr:peptidoglycan editing factor PgeF [Cellulomons edaphi]MDM7832016.1 peptidoglycan editing factor PgeF [Cellulomons edaphi]